MCNYLTCCFIYFEEMVAVGLLSENKMPVWGSYRHYFISECDIESFYLAGMFFNISKRNIHHLSTEDICTFSAGECASLIVGPQDIISR